MTPFSQFALLDAVVAGCKWRTCTASNSGTQPAHSRLYTKREKSRLVLSGGGHRGRLQASVEKIVTSARVSGQITSSMRRLLDRPFGVAVETRG